MTSQKESSAQVNEGSVEIIDSAIWSEFRKASQKFSRFHNAHEGYAVLKEEVDELWDAVKLNQSNPGGAGMMQKEAIQVAAMAIRFLHDVSFDAGGSDP
jgi:hypothetical protein